MNYSEACALSDNELAAAISASNASLVAAMSSDELERFRRGEWTEPPGVAMPACVLVHTEDFETDLRIPARDRFELYYG